MLGEIMGNRSSGNSNLYWSFTNNLVTGGMDSLGRKLSCLLLSFLRFLVLNLKYSNNMRHFKCCEPPRVLHEELSTRHLTKKKSE